MSNEIAPVAAPDGFDISAGRTMGDGWMKKEKDNTVFGRLMGRHELDDRAFYQVKLNAPCKATTGKGEEIKDVTLQAGQIVNVDESKALQDLKKYARYMDHGGVYDVWIKLGDKVKLDGGNTFWPVIDGPRLKQIKAPKIPKDDGVPF